MPEKQVASLSTVQIALGLHLGFPRTNAQKLKHHWTHLEGIIRSSADVEILMLTECCLTFKSAFDWYPCLRYPSQDQSCTCVETKWTLRVRNMVD
jgi:hypothetical protein